MFSNLKEKADHPHEYAKEWKEKTGGKVIGYFCTYAPEEVMYAAGILPVRIMGGKEPQIASLSEPHIFGMFCPWCRNCLGQGLAGRYAYLDGIVEAHSCLHLRQSFGSWKLHIPVDFAHYLVMPHAVQSPHAYTLLFKELENFKNKLEEWTGKTITEDDLNAAIEVYDTNRQLMKQIYETRRQEIPLISGQEAMHMVLASQVMDKKEQNEELKKIIAALPNRLPAKEREGIRLMHIGSEQNDTDFVGMVESLNAVVVIDDHCGGTRYFWNTTPAEGSALDRIARRYVDRPRCPSKDWPKRDRLTYIRQLAQAYNIQGALLIQQKFCDPHEADMPVIGQMFKEMGIPTYPLELDVTVPYGQFKIRLEAFIEMIQQDLLF